MLQDEIMKLGDYFRGIEYFNDALIVKVIFPNRWQVYPSADGNIKPANDNETGEYYYYGDMNKVSLDDIFVLIKETIDANKDAELKIQLLNDKVQELKELFKKESYDRLSKMKFTIEDEIKEKKPKRKYNKKKKEEENSVVEEENVITEEKIESNIVNEEL